MRRFWALLILIGTSISYVVAQPLIWNLDRLDVVRDNPTAYPIYSRCVSTAGGYASADPVVITDKTKSFAPNSHYYCSIATYWWPDSTNTNKYIRKDGYVNPETNEFDYKRLKELVKRTRCLSIAYYWTGDIKYHEAFQKQLIAWFIDESTYMYPNMDYTQVRIGYNNNRGYGAGLVEAYFFVDVLESLRLVQAIKPIDVNIYNGVKDWFSLFLKWLQNSNMSINLRKTQNNIPLMTDVLMVYLADFCEDKQLGKEIVKNFASYRLAMQIKEDGSQPAELKRSCAFTYSISNLTHIVDFCIMMESIGVEFYKENKIIINSAFGYLYQYVGHTETFPYSQLNWKNMEKSLMTQMKRLQRLKPKCNRAFDFKALETYDYFAKLSYLVL